MKKSKNVGKFGSWLKDALKSGLHAMQRFARTAQRGIDAVRNAITEPWSNGQTPQQEVRKNAFDGFFGAKFDILCRRPQRQATGSGRT